MLNAKLGKCSVFLLFIIFPPYLNVVNEWGGVTHLETSHLPVSHLLWGGYFPVFAWGRSQSPLEWIFDRFLQVSELCWSCRWMETAQPPTPPSWASRASTWRRVTMSSSLKKVRSIRKAENTSCCGRFDLKHVFFLQTTRRRVWTTTTTAASRRTSENRTSTCPSLTWLASWRTLSLRRGRWGVAPVVAIGDHWISLNLAGVGGVTQPQGEWRGFAAFLLRSPKTQRSVSKSV